MSNDKKGNPMKQMTAEELAVAFGEDDEFRGMMAKAWETFNNRHGLFQGWHGHAADLQCELGEGFKVSITEEGHGMFQAHVSLDDADFDEDGDLSTTEGGAVDFLRSTSSVRAILHAVQHARGQS